MPSSRTTFPLLTTLTVSTPWRGVEKVRPGISTPDREPVELSRMAPEIGRPFRNTRTLP